MRVNSYRNNNVDVHTDHSNHTRNDETVPDVEDPYCPSPSSRSSKSRRAHRTDYSFTDSHSNIDVSGGRDQQDQGSEEGEGADDVGFEIVPNRSLTSTYTGDDDNDDDDDDDDTLDSNDPEKGHRSMCCFLPSCRSACLVPTLTFTYVVLLITLFTLPRFVFSEDENSDGFADLANGIAMVVLIGSIAVFVSIVSLMTTCNRWKALSPAYRTMGLFPIVTTVIIVITLMIVLKLQQDNIESSGTSSGTTASGGGGSSGDDLPPCSKLGSEQGHVYYDGTENTHSPADTLCVQQQKEEMPGN